jgi:hypothetical protein
VSRSFENLVYWAQKAAALDNETEERESKYYLMAKKSSRWGQIFTFCKFQFLLDRISILC